MSKARSHFSQLGWFGVALSLVTALSSCATDTQDDPEGSQESPKTPEITITNIGTPDGHAKTNDHPDRGLEGTWAGQYKCAQGAMLIDVEIVRRHGGELSAEVGFNPSEHAVEGVSSGSWSARMLFSENSRTATFEPDSWIDKPGEQYQMLALKGRLDRSEMHITGDVFGDRSCSKFTLDRTGEHPYTGLRIEPEAPEETESIDESGVMGRWKGSYNCSGNKMNLDIMVRPTDEGTPKADVMFKPDPTDSSGLEGGHWIASVEDNGPGSSVRFLPTAWVTEPTTGYKMLEFSGRLNDKADQITGDIANQSGCSNVILRRPSHKEQ